MFSFLRKTGRILTKMNFYYFIALVVSFLIQSTSSEHYEHHLYSKKLYQCIARCRGPHEGCVQCSGPCFDSCATFRLLSGCTKITCQLGVYYCSCKEGYKRHPVTKQCVLACQCPETYEYDYVNDVVVTGKIQVISTY